MMTLAGLFLIAVSALLVWSQWRSRGRAIDAAQFRRRLLTSLLMGFLGVAILSGQVIVATVSPLAFMLFWLAVLALAGMLGVSGFVDLLITRAKSRREIHDHQVELRRLKSELNQVEEQQRRAHGHRQNGKAARHSTTDGTRPG